MTQNTTALVEDLGLVLTHLYICSQSFVVHLVPGDLNSSSDLCEHQECIWCTYIYAHTHKIKCINLNKTNKQTQTNTPSHVLTYLERCPSHFPSCIESFKPYLWYTVLLFLPICQLPIEINVVFYLISLRCNYPNTQLVNQEKFKSPSGFLFSLHLCCEISNILSRTASSPVWVSKQMWSEAFWLPHNNDQCKRGMGLPRWMSVSFGIVGQCGITLANVVCSDLYSTS